MRLDEAKGAWADELGSVLLSYLTMSQSTMGVTSFKLTYGVDVMILIEVEEPSLTVVFQSTSSQVVQKEADLTEETREMAHIREKALKQRVANRYNSAIVP